MFPIHTCFTSTESASSSTSTAAGCYVRQGFSSSSWCLLWCVALAMSSNGLVNSLGRWFRFAIGILVRCVAQQLVEVLNIRVYQPLLSDNKWTLMGLLMSSVLDAHLALDVRHDVFLSSAFREGLDLLKLQLDRNREGRSTQTSSQNQGPCHCRERMLSGWCRSSGSSRISALDMIKFGQNRSCGGLAVDSTCLGSRHSHVREQQFLSYIELLFQLSTVYSTTG